MGGPTECRRFALEKSPADLASHLGVRRHAAPRETDQRLLTGG